MNYKLIMKNAHGFTLIELMVTLAIFAIVTMLAFPGFQLYQQNSARVTNINDLVAAFNLSRSEAVKQGLNVIVCASADQATCSGANDWTTGWIAFVDADNNAALNAGDTTILTHGALSGANLVFNDVEGGLSSITYQSTGITATPATFRRYDNRCVTLPNATNDEHIRAVIVMPSGQIRMSKDNNNDGSHEARDGATELLCP